MNDHLVRMVARNIGVRAVACDTTDLVQEGLRRHKASPAASHMLAQTLTAGAMMARR